MPEIKGPTHDNTAEKLRATEVLHSIIDIPRMPSAEYQSLIKQQERRGESSRWTPANYAMGWEDLLEPKENIVKTFFKHHLSGQVLVDLGGGNSWMRDVAREFGSSTYINVDRAPYDRTKIPNPLVPAGFWLEGEMWDLQIHSDMLDFISRIKDNSVCCTINGIDSSIVDDADYNRALAREMMRATKKGGLIFGTYSDALLTIDSWMGESQTKPKPIKFNRADGFKMNDKTFIFEKVE